MLISAKDRKRLLRQKLERDIKNKERKGPRGKSILDNSNQNIQFFDPKQGTKIKKGIYTCYIDIIPWIIKTDKYPDRDFKPGYEAWVLEVGVHRGIGPANDQIVCNRFTYNGKCYLCDQSKILYEDDNEKEASKLWPSWRVLYNVIDKNNEDKGMQLFYTSRKNFHEALLNELEIIQEKNGDKIEPYDLDNGYSIEFRAETKIYNAGDKKIEYFQFSNFQFEKRDKYNEKILEEAYCLDEMLILHSQDEVKRIYLNEGDNLPEKEEKTEEAVNTERKSRRKVDREEKKEEKNVIQALRIEIKNKYPDAYKKLTRKETEEELKKILESLELVDVEEKNDKETYGTCPFEYNFGHDCDDQPSCSDCDPELWKDCAAEYDRINKEVPY